MKRILLLLTPLLFFVACSTTSEGDSVNIDHGSSTQRVTIFDPSRLSETSIQYMNLEFKLIDGWSIIEDAELYEKDGIEKIALMSPGGSLMMQMNEYGYELSPMEVMTLSNGVVVHQNPCGGALSCHILKTDDKLYEVAFVPLDGWPEVSEEDLLQILTSVEYTQ